MLRSDNVMPSDTTEARKAISLSRSPMNDSEAPMTSPIAPAANSEVVSVMTFLNRSHSATRPCTGLPPAGASFVSDAAIAGIASEASNCPDSTSLFSSCVVRPNCCASNGRTPGSASPSCCRNSSMLATPLLAI